MSNSINKVIEQVAYKQVEDMIVYLEMLDEQFLKTSKTARETSKSFSMPSGNNSDLNKKLLESQKVIIQLQKDYNNNREALEKLTKKLEGYSNAQRNTTKANYDNSISQSILLKNVKEEEVKTSTLTTYIQKLSVERIQASRIVADYNAQIAMGNKLTEEQSQELTQATAQFQKYDNAIKAGKTSIGDAREYVGQYERANTGLSNSVAQIARELPAATYGFQTFALGISNNFPIMIDEIKKAVAVNEDLIKKNKEVVPVWKQVQSAIFSFNTLMSIGLLLLASYGKEIANFTKELFGASEALDEVNNRQKEFNKAKLEGKKDAQSDIIELRKYLAVVKDRTIADDLRQIALKKLRADYPYYFKNLTDEQILTGKTSEAVKQLTIDLEKRKEVDKKTDLNIKNRQRLIDLEKEKELQKDIILQTEEQGKRLAKQEFVRPEALAEIGNRQAKAREKLNKIEIEANLITKNTIENEKDIFNLKTETIALEYQDTDSKEKNTKAIKLNTKAREDYLASEYELLHLKLSNAKDINKDIMDDESMNYEIRELATEQYYNNLISLADMEYKEEMRLLALNYNNTIATKKAEYENEKNTLNDQLNDEKQSASNKEIIRKQLAQNTSDLEYDLANLKKQLGFNEQIASENLNKKLYDSAKELKDKLFDLWNNEIKIKIELGIATEELEDTKRLGELLKSIDFDNLAPTQANINTIKDKLKEIADLKTFYNRKSSADKLETDEQDLIMQMENFSKTEHNSKLYIDLEKKLTENRKQQADLRNEIASDEIQKKEDNLEKEKAIIDKQTELAKEFYFSLKDLANQLFDNTVNSYDKQIEKSNEYYDTLLANAEKGSEQEKLIQEEKDRREEELQRKKIEAQRKQALFNKILKIAEITIETAKNIVSVFPNPVLMALAGGIGAVSIATVAATPLPQYKDGTDYHKGGKAVLGDGYVNEVVENPDGSIFLTPNKPTILDLPKGAKVHSSLEDFNKNKLNLESASIMASFTNQSNQLKSFDYYIGKELKGLPEKIEKGIEKGFKNAKIHNTIQNNINFDKKQGNFFN